MTKKFKNFYYDEKNPRCDKMELNKNGYPVYKNNPRNYVHRHIAKKYLNRNRPLETWEEVHHVDGDKLNYDPSNLTILYNKDHRKISKRLKKEVNINKANELIFFILLILFFLGNRHNWILLNKIIFTLLIIGFLIPAYSNVASWFMRKTKLYKF